VCAPLAVGVGRRADLIGVLQRKKISALPGIKIRFFDCCSSPFPQSLTDRSTPAPTIAMTSLSVDTFAARSRKDESVSCDTFLSTFVGQDSVVGIATRYGLDGPGIESR
jgi:hypothetical protein